MRSQRQGCPRCHGLMVATYSDMASPNDEGHDVLGHRCVNCGEYVDQLVLQNRWVQQGMPPLSLQLRRGRSAPGRSLSHPTRQRRAAA